MFLNLVVTWLVTAIALFLVSKLPTGVEIDDFPKALISAIVFGLLNAIVRPILGVLVAPAALIFSSLLITLVLNLIIFSVAAKLVEGFRLTWGFWSALLGSVALTIIASLIYQILPFGVAT